MTCKPPFAKRVASSRWAGQGHVLLCYLLPLLLLGVLYLPIDGYIFFRNWCRAACGPLLPVMMKAGCDPNDLTTYAVAFGVTWLSWLLAVSLTPLHRLPLAAHIAFGFLWCFGGCCLTASV